MQNQHRKVQGSTRGQDAGRASEKTERSRWFDDETFEITADTSTSGKVRLPAISEALGDGLSEMPWLHREVYLDNRAEGEPKLEGSERAPCSAEKLCDSCKKLLKV